MQITDTPLCLLLLLSMSAIISGISRSLCDLQTKSKHTNDSLDKTSMLSIFFQKFKYLKLDETEVRYNQLLNRFSIIYFKILFNYVFNTFFFFNKLCKTKVFKIGGCAGQIILFVLYNININLISQFVIYCLIIILDKNRTTNLFSF